VTAGGRPADRRQQNKSRALIDVGNCMRKCFSPSSALAPCCYCHVGLTDALQDIGVRRGMQWLHVHPPGRELENFMGLNLGTKTIVRRHVLRGSSGKNALLILEGKFEGKKPRGRPRRMWIDDVLQKLDKTKYQEVKRMAEDRKTWRKMTHQPSYREDGN